MNISKDNLEVLILNYLEGENGIIRNSPANMEFESKTYFSELFVCVSEEKKALHVQFVYHMECDGLVEKHRTEKVDFWISFNELSGEEHLRKLSETVHIDINCLYKLITILWDAFTGKKG